MELKYQQALKRLKRAYPEDFCGWGPASAFGQEHVRLGGGPREKGFPDCSRAASCKGSRLEDARKRRLYARVCVCRLCLSLLSIYIYIEFICLQHVG